MESPTLGQTPKVLGERDAVHVAIIAVRAGEVLARGDKVTVENGSAIESSHNPLGIVDPFLEDIIKEGDVFWLVLFPQSVRGMKHHWSHPSFSDEKQKCFGFTKEESREWLEDFVDRSDCPDYQTLITAATAGELKSSDPKYYRTGYTLDDDYLHFNGLDAHGDIPPEFWDHVENVTGLLCPVRPHSFSCSC